MFWVSRNTLVTKIYNIISWEFRVEYNAWQNLSERNKMIVAHISNKTLYKIGAHFAGLLLTKGDVCCILGQQTLVELHAM